MHASNELVGVALPRPPPVEGEPYFDRRRFLVAPLADTDFDGRPAAFPAEAPCGASSDVSVVMNSYRCLAPDDAVALLDGRDETGLMLWDGGSLLARMLTRTPRASLLRRAADAPARTIVVELGAGAGLCSIVVASLLRTFQSSARATVLATDGNPACVDLLCRNIGEASAEPSEAGACVVRTAAALWRWDQALLPEPLLSELHPATESSSSSSSSDNQQRSSSPPAHVVALAADVIYATEAIAPFVAALVALREECRRCGPTIVESCVLHFMFVPRCFTDEMNRSNYALLRKRFDECGFEMIAEASLRGGLATMHTLSLL